MFRILCILFDQLLQVWHTWLFYSLLPILIDVLQWHCTKPFNSRDNYYLICGEYFYIPNKRIRVNIQSYSVSQGEPNKRGARRPGPLDNVLGSELGSSSRLAPNYIWKVSKKHKTTKRTKLREGSAKCRRWLLLWCYKIYYFNICC